MAALLDSGSHERLKGSVHFALGGLALICATYNAARLHRTGQARNAWCLGLYTALVLFEVGRVKHHWLASVSDTPD